MYTADYVSNALLRSESPPQTFLVLEATATEVNNLDGTFSRVLQKDVLWITNMSSRKRYELNTTYLGLQIAMDHSMMT